MTNEKLLDVLSRYPIQSSEIIFIRHSENKTYRVRDKSGNSYLLRIHLPFRESMKGKQHTYEGILGELLMMEELALWSEHNVQTPLRNRDGEFITVIEHEGELRNCSVITWLDGRDMMKDDGHHVELVRKIGSSLAELHAFFRQYVPVDLGNRPSQGIAYHEHLNRMIQSGVQKELFTSNDAGIIEQTILLINSRLDGDNRTDGPDLIHGDLNRSNTIITAEGEVRFIDYGFFGSGYASLDVAMGAMMLSPDLRDDYLSEYYRERSITPNDFLRLEGFMLTAIIGYYVFQLENEQVHGWMRERMPKLCAELCLPFLNSKRIFYQI